MSLIQRFLLGNRAEDDLQVGLFLKNDGTVWLRNPDGTETQLPGGGGGGLPSVVSTRFATANNYVDPACIAPFVADPAALTGGFSQTLTSTIMAVGAGATAVTVFDGIPTGALVVQGLPVSADAFDLTFFAEITNLDSSEWLELQASGSIPAGETSGILDLSAMVVNPLAGSDLAWTYGPSDPPSNVGLVQSTAGGVFMATLLVTGSWS